MKAKAPVIALAGFAAGTGAFAQTAPVTPTGAPPAAGAVTSAFIASELEYNDNFDLRPDSAGDAYLWNNIVGADIERRTSIDTFIASAQGTLRFADLPVTGTETDADDGRLALAYDRVVEDSAIGADLRFQYVDVNFFDPLSDIDPNGNFDSTVGGGTRQSLRGGFNVDLNTNGPVTVSLVGRGNDVRFVDNTDPDNFDRQDVSLDAQVGFVVSQTLRYTTGAFYRYETRDDLEDTDIETVRADVGIVGDINPRARLTGRIGYSEVETRRDSGNDTDSGVVGDLGVVITQQTGEVRGGVTQIVDENGTRTSVTVGAVRNWPNGTLDGDVGVSVSDDTDASLVGNVSYSYALPRTTFRASFRQVAAVDEDGNDVLNTFASVGLSQAVTNVSAINLNLSGGLQRSQDDSVTESERVNLSAAYVQTITRDWSWNLGYRYELQDDEGQERATANSVFVGLRRDFSTIR